MFREHDRIVLTSDIPEEGLKAGDEGVHTLGAVKFDPQYPGFFRFV